MDMSMKNKQINALNTLTKYMDANPLAKELNYTLDSLNKNALGKFLNELTHEEFIKIKDDKRLKVENPMLAKMLNGKLIDDKEEYLNKHVKYDISFDLDKIVSYNLSYFLRHESKQITFFVKNEEFLNSLLAHPTRFNENLLADFESGLTVNLGRYSFNRNAFSEEFNKSFIDYIQNYEIYQNHPRIGKEKLLKVAKEIIQQELPNGKSTLLIEFENFSIELETSKIKD